MSENKNLFHTFLLSIAFGIDQVDQLFSVFLITAVLPAISPKNNQWWWEPRSNARWNLEQRYSVVSYDTCQNARWTNSAFSYRIFPNIHLNNFVLYLIISLQCKHIFTNTCTHAQIPTATDSLSLFNRAVIRTNCNFLKQYKHVFVKYVVMRSTYAAIFNKGVTQNILHFLLSITLDCQLD